MKDKVITFLIGFIFLYALGGGFCGLFFPATVTPFMELTCPEGTTASAEQVRRSTGNGISISLRLDCEGDAAASSRSAGAFWGRFFHQTTIALILMGVLWVWMRTPVWSRESAPPAPPPGIHMEGDMTLRQLISEKRRIEAVKYVREMAGTSLKEAKDYVDWLSYQMQGDGTAGNPVTAMTPQEKLDAAAHDFEVLDALTNGQKINAIKRVRQLTGLGLREAKDFVDALERGDIVVRDGPVVRPPQPPDTAAPGDAFYDPEVQEYLAQGRKIDAIKRVRELTRLGLKEAKDLVESWEGRF